LTLTVDAPGATQLKVAVLEVGYSASLDHKETGELNMCMALGETVFVVPEIASLFLALAPVSSLGLYMYKQKKNKNAT
jgi:hypothetical protein